MRKIKEVILRCKKRHPVQIKQVFVDEFGDITIIAYCPHCNTTGKSEIHPFELFKEKPDPSP